MHLAILAIIFSVTLSSTSTLLKRNPLETLQIYYNCGPFTFHEDKLKNYVHRYSQEYNNISKPFQGLLYDQNLNYRTIKAAKYLIKPYERSDIRPGAANDKHFKVQIVIDQLNHIVDVIVEMKNGHFIKCKRFEKSKPDSPRIESNELSYQCGHELFTQKTVEFSKVEAMRIMNKGLKYPAPYRGSLYRPELGYHIYPILRGERIPQTGKFPETTYFIVISSSSEVVDVIAELSGGDFMKCTRSTVNSDDSLENDLHVGYLCGANFFDVSLLKQSAVLAYQKKDHIKPKTYPKIYRGAPFFKDHWIYPVYPNGRFFGKVNRRPKYFLVMNLSFEIILVAIKGPQGMVPCEEYLRGLEAAPEETDDFICSLHDFKHDHLMATVKNGCTALGTTNRKFPAKYVGPNFNIPGPYFTWPLIYGKMFRKVTGNLRVVMNSECQLAGVIENWEGVFKKCVRKKDNSVPGGKSQIEISETPLLTVESLYHGSESFCKQNQNSVTTSQINSNELCNLAPVIDYQVTNDVFLEQDYRLW